MEPRSNLLQLQPVYPAGARYCEFSPCAELRRHVRAFFTFTAPAEEPIADRVPIRETFFRNDELRCSPLFADGHVSVVFSFGSAYRVDQLWPPNPSGPGGHVIGAMTIARPASHGERVVQVGAYLRAARSRPITSLPACELTDRIVPLGDLWGTAGASLETRLREAKYDAERVSLLETAILNRITRYGIPQGGINLPGLARHAVISEGKASVEDLAAAAGVSLQYLTRRFRHEVGVTPKLYCRLARFRAALAYVHARERLDWADVAARLNYADQSHLIAEFTEFAGLTPGRIALDRRFHPFMETPRSRR